MQQRPLLLRHHNKKEKNTKWIARYNRSLEMNGVDMNHCYRDFPSEIIGKSTLLTSSAPPDVSGSTIELVADVMQGIFITKNGKNIARLPSPAVNKLTVLDSLVGIVPQDSVMDEETIRKERLARQ